MEAIDFLLHLLKHAHPYLIKCWSGITVLQQPKGRKRVTLPSDAGTCTAHWGRARKCAASRCHGGCPSPKSSPFVPLPSEQPCRDATRLLLSESQISDMQIIITAKPSSWFVHRHKNLAGPETQEMLKTANLAAMAALLKRQNPMAMLLSA